MTHLRLSCLGSPEIWYGGQLLAFPTRKALALLVYLAVEGGLQPREKLLALLWPESDLGRGRGALRTTLAHLRRALDPAETAGRQTYLVSEGDALGFDLASAYKLDLDMVKTAVKAGQMAPFQEAIALYRGDFLAGFSLPDAPTFDEWVTFQREWWHRQMNTVFERLSGLQSERRDFAGGIETAIRWVAHDPLNEAAQRRLMQLYFMSGDRTAALRAYTACQTILAAELGAEPSAETKTLAERIRTASPPGRALAATRQPTPLAELPLVGRAAEHSQLVSSYRQACQGETQVVCLIGEAGIGKTRLAHAFLNWVALEDPAAEGAATNILTGRAFEVGGRLPYQPLMDALRVRLEQENAPDDLLADVWLAELSQLLPELRDRYLDLPPAMSGEPDFVRSRIFEAVARLVEALATRRPVLLFVDDLQWADEGALDMLLYLSRRWAQDQMPVLLLLTARQEDLTTTISLRNWLNNLGRGAPLTRLHLPALTPTAVQQLIGILAGGGTGDNVAEQAVIPKFGAWLQTETGGVPFFVEAMLQMLIEQGILTRRQPPGRSYFDVVAAWQHIQREGGLPLPPGVREVILNRLGHLSDLARALLLAGAVIGRACSFERLCQVSGVAELDGLTALEELLNSRLMLEMGSELRPYNFAHDNIRQVIYTEAGEARRRLYHRRALAALEQADAPVAELAFHALAGRLDAPACRYSLAAGDDALAAHAPVEAIAHYNRAREITSRATIGSELLGQLYTCRGRALELNNQYDEALANYEEMAKLAVERGDKALELASLTAQCIVRATQTPLYNPTEARKAGEAALALARELGDRATEAKVLWGLLLVEYWGGGDNHKAQAYGQQSLAIARELGLKEQIAFTLTDLVHTYFGLDQVEAARQANLETRAMWQALNNIPMLIDAYGTGVWSHLFAAEYEAALQTATETLRLSQSVGNVWNYTGALATMGATYLALGDIGRAISSLEEAIGRAKEANVLGTTHIAFPYFILAYLTAGALDQARQLADELYAMRDAIIRVWLSNSLGIIIQVKVKQSDLVGAQRLLKEAYQELDIDNLPLVQVERMLLAEAHLQLALGKPGRALERMQVLTGRARRAGIRLYLPEALWLQGKALLALEQTEQARQVFLEGQQVAAETGARRMWWPILWALSQLETVAGNTAEAERLRQQAREIVTYIADHAGSEELRASFLALPEVCQLLVETGNTS